LIASCTTGAVDVARREDHVHLLAEELRRARLRDRRLVALRVARDDLQLASVDATLGVPLLDTDLGRGERRPVERRHGAFRVEGPPDHDRLAGRRCGARNHGYNRGDHRDERCERPLLPQSHYALLGAFDGFTNL
jgi:hypothetical protein